MRVTVSITDLAHDGRGVGRIDGKAVFVHGALPGEKVSARLTGRKRRFDEAVCIEVMQPSPERTAPPCPWFGYCGGCALQHLDHDAQIAWKRRRVADNLQRIGRVQPGRWLEPVVGEPWLYRRRARLSAREVPGKGRVLVGFREINARYVADIEHCRVLHPAFSERLMDLSDLLGRLSVSDAVPQVEVAAGEDSAAVILRHLRSLTTADEQELKAYTDASGIAVYLQPEGPDSIHRLAPENHELSYRLPAFGLEIGFEPQHFVQVNDTVNRELVSLAVDLLDPRPGDRMLDLFCGIGNFTLPLATRAGEIIGVDGDPALLVAGAANARRNGMDNLRWVNADLAGIDAGPSWLPDACAGVLLDPPRSGADAVLPLISNGGASRIVYVSCNPATLARDAAELVHDMGYELRAAGVVDMFPHTSHVEAIALFERPK